MTVKPDKTTSDEQLLSDIVTSFKKITKQPAQFLCELSAEKCKTIRDLVQQTYQVAVHHDVKNQNNINILSELVVEDMDEEQIWQQLELRNDEVLQQLNKEVPKMLNLAENYFEIRLNEEEDDLDEEEEEEEDLMNDDEEEEEEDGNDVESEAEAEEAQKFEKKQVTRKGRKSVVDDKFFKLSEMERYLEEEDAKEMRKSKGKMREDDETGIDFFAENAEESEEDEENINYKDFFESDDEIENEENKKNKKDYFAAIDENQEEKEEEEEKELEQDEEEEEEDEDNEEVENQEEEEDDDDDDDDEEENLNEKSNNYEPASDSDSETDEEREKVVEKSSFEMRQERLQARIRDYEEEVLGEKPWQLKGEIVANSRPQNSLLEEVLEFESTTRPAPVITEETTRRLEDIIRQRIKDQAWDDVEQKVRPQLTQQEFRKQLVLDQEKSKQSLAQIYESEYQKEVAKLNPDGPDQNAEENPAHAEIKKLMHNLFIKLDALSNFHFVPKPVAPEAKIVTNTPAINMEEVAPIAMTDANLLAPEEVYRHAKKQIMGKSERTRTDKNRERRNKKQKQRAIQKALEAKDLRKQKLGIPLSKKEEASKALKSITKHRNVEKVTANNDKSALKSSKSFFTQLQDQTSSNVNKKRKQPNEDLKKGLTPKKLKL